MDIAEGDKVQFIRGIEKDLGHGIGLPWIEEGDIGEVVFCNTLSDIIDIQVEGKFGVVHISTEAMSKFIRKLTVIDIIRIRANRI